MAKAFMIDVALCNGCYNCQIVCKDEHCDNDWTPYAAPQPLTGQFWLHMNERERGQVPWVRVSYKPVLCAHCADAPCEKACTSGAFVRREDGLSYIDPTVCTGCGACVTACPLDAIFMNDERSIAQKCTGCAHLLDSEDWNGLPRCADACPTGALRFGDEKDFADEMIDAQPLDEVSAFGARVFYRHLPKRFVAGTAVDIADDEVLIGARVELVRDNAVVAYQDTDDFGDFKFDDVEPAVYTVSVKADGFEVYEVQADLTEIDVSVGDLFLEKERGM